MKRQNRVAFFNILSTLILDGIAFFTSPLFYELLGDSGYGVLSIYTIWTSAVAILFTMQTQGTLVNATVEYSPEEQKKYQSSVMTLSMMVFAICAALVMIFVKPLSRLLKLDWYLLLLMLLQAFGTFAVGFLSTKLIYEFKAGWKMILSVGVTLTTLTLSLILVLNLPHETRYLGRIAAIASTYGLIGIPVSISILAKGRTFFNRDYWKFCVALAIPSVFYSLSDLILGQTDRVMLQQMLSDAMVGQYSIALQFGGIMFIIFGALNHTWCPFFFEDMKQGNREAVLERSRNFLELFTVLSVGFLLLVREVFHFLVPRATEASTLLIPVFVTSYFLNFLCTFPVNYEYFRMKTKVVAIVTITSSATNLVLNYFLILKWGMFGAALATALSHCLQLALHFGYTRFVLGKDDYPFQSKLWRSYLLAYLAVLALVYALPQAFLLRWALGAAIGVWELLRIKKRKVLI